MNDVRGSDYVMRRVREGGVKFIGLWFSDVAGRLKSVSITDQQVETALTDGIAFDGGTMMGLARHEETDLLLLPDPETFAILPWRSGDATVARMFCALVGANRQPCDHDPRNVLKAALARAQALGYTHYVACEVENYYFRGNGLPLAVTDRGTYFDVTPGHDVIGVRRDTVIALEQLGIAVESTHHEVGPGQYEIKLSYSDALSMADGLMTYRLCVKQLAQPTGLVASFMPKPLADANGSGLHLSLSLSQGGQPAFSDPTDPLGLSETAKQFAAGLLAHAPALTLVTNQWVNSYKRLVPGFEAPTACTWARANWDDLIRVPAPQATPEGATYLEYRAPDPACNPYLAFAVLLAAGLDGIERKLQPPPLRGRGEPQDAPPLPSTLAEAIAAAESSELLRAALGPALMGSLLENARLEWRSYHAQVSQWELDRYFPTL
jgi:glutamine synthetase